MTIENLNQSAKSAEMPKKTELEMLMDTAKFDLASGLVDDVLTFLKRFDNNKPEQYEIRQSFLFNNKEIAKTGFKKCVDTGDLDGARTLNELFQLNEQL